MRSGPAGLRFIFCTLFLDVLGIGLVIPTLPDVIRRFGHSELFVTEYYGYFVSVYSLMQLLMSPLLGVLSDRYGRRPVLLVSLLGAGLDYLLMAFAPNLTWLFLGRMISGLTGASMTVATSYIADISTDANRAANFGVMGAAFGLGFIFGPLIGGLLGANGAHWPFIAAAVLNLLNFTFGLFVLPESLALELRRPVEVSRLNPLSALIHAFSHPGMLLLVWVHFFTQISGQVYPSIWTLYVQHRFHWTPVEVGLSLCAVGVVSAIVMGGLTRPIVARLGEFKTLAWGLFAQSLSFLGFAFVPSGWMLYGVIVVSGLGGMGGPALQSLISATIPSQEQGELQGSLVSVTSLAAILAPLIYTRGLEFGILQWDFPGLPFLVALLLSFVSAGLLYQRRRHTH